MFLFDFLQCTIASHYTPPCELDFGKERYKKHLLFVLKEKGKTF